VKRKGKKWKKIENKKPKGKWGFWVASRGGGGRGPSPAATSSTRLGLERKGSDIEGVVTFFKNQKKQNKEIYFNGEDRSP